MRIAMLIGSLAAAIALSGATAQQPYRPYAVKPYDPYDLPKNDDFRPSRNPYDLPEQSRPSRSRLTAAPTVRSQPGGNEDLKYYGGEMYLRPAAPRAPRSGIYEKPQRPIDGRCYWSNCR